LNPAKISKVLILDANEKRMEVIVEEKQQSLAIGKKGQNVRLASKLIGWQIDVKSEEQKKAEVLSVMESLTSSTTPLTDLEGISDRLIEKLREAGIETVERIIEMGIEKLQEIPGIGEKTAAKIMDAARDLFEEVEIEVPEGVELPTAIRAVATYAEPSVQEQPAKPAEEGEAARPKGETGESQAEPMPPAESEAGAEPPEEQK
ncbi:MAG: KH domain-containing protein, partial [Acidobacteria bacterium]|nr:KH domain-containing protein [Acidobacteriota bacterium]